MQGWQWSQHLLIVTLIRRGGGQNYKNLQTSYKYRPFPDDGTDEAHRIPDRRRIGVILPLRLIGLVALVPMSKVEVCGRGELVVLGPDPRLNLIAVLCPRDELLAQEVPWNRLGEHSFGEGEGGAGIYLFNTVEHIIKLSHNSASSVLNGIAINRTRYGILRKNF